MPNPKLAPWQIDEIVAEFERYQREASESGVVQ